MWPAPADQPMPPPPGPHHHAAGGPGGRGGLCRPGAFAAISRCRSEAPGCPDRPADASRRRGLGGWGGSGRPVKRQRCCWLRRCRSRDRRCRGREHRGREHRRSERPAWRSSGTGWSGDSRRRPGTAAGDPRGSAEGVGLAAAVGERGLATQRPSGSGVAARRPWTSGRSRSALRCGSRWANCSTPSRCELWEEKSVTSI